MATGNADLVDPGWASRTSAATGIPLRALLGYAGAELAMASEAAGCNIGWSTLAALGRIESAHGTHTGSVVGDDSVTRPGIFGIDLTGVSSARITDTDEGRWDGKADIDRAVGPMQFIPATWETWRADGNGDGIRDPQHIDDAALAAARYLCHYGDLSSPDSWRRAIFAYNHLDTYVNAVAQAANEYAGRASG
ncbi:lytic transglycosylase domain-containing protein [Salinibacterium sp. ZJ454]|uniref:lytic transglycosylase domain-containing protein n=1 Tax=Salinibacterium sp. ZJ454 TaxID=2708339 RepID=UPI001FB956B0|nr:lytic transglycosylase domain-containing protein [Salinibacterium sp. ZJ454]